MDNFARLSSEERGEYFELAANQSLRFGTHILEKDFWVCWTLKQLFSITSLNPHIIFKGGTSLSKVFQVIGRFSEDVDISLSKEIFGFTGDKDPERGKSTTEKTKRIKELKEVCSTFVKKDLLNELKATMSLVLGSKTPGS